jgi:NAD-dependent dihydropyrimidine dehydrogenase PreA subunit
LPCALANDPGVERQRFGYTKGWADTAKESAVVVDGRRTVAHTIVTNVCEGVADCVDACPVACINEGPGKNTKGTDWYWIDFSTCIDCGICLQVCPVNGAILPEEKPELQETPA